jgi:hypothetical protein
MNQENPNPHIEQDTLDASYRSFCRKATVENYLAMQMNLFYALLERTKNDPPKDEPDVLAYIARMTKISHLQSIAVKTVHDKASDYKCIGSPVKFESNE